MKHYYTSYDLQTKSWAVVSVTGVHGHARTEAGAKRIRWRIMHPSKKLSDSLGRVG